MNIFYMKMEVILLLILAWNGVQLQAFCSPEYIESKRGTFTDVEQENKKVVQPPKKNNWITYDQMERRREAKWDAQRAKARAIEMEELKENPIY